MFYFIFFSTLHGPEMRVVKTGNVVGYWEEKKKKITNNDFLA